MEKSEEFFARIANECICCETSSDRATTSNPLRNEFTENKNPFSRLINSNQLFSHTLSSDGCNCARIYVLIPSPSRPPPSSAHFFRSLRRSLPPVEANLNYNASKNRTSIKRGGKCVAAHDTSFILAPHRRFLCEFPVSRFSICAVSDDYE